MKKLIFLICVCILLNLSNLFSMGGHPINTIRNPMREDVDANNKDILNVSDGSFDTLVVTNTMSVTSITFPDGTVQISSPSAGGSAGNFRQVFFAGGATVSAYDNAGVYEAATVVKNEFSINNSTRPVYSVTYTSYTERFAYWDQTMDEDFDSTQDVNLYIEFYSAVTSSSALFNVRIATMTNPSTRTWALYQANEAGIGGTAYDIVVATLTWTSNSVGFMAGKPYGICLSRNKDTVDALGDIYVLKMKLIGTKQ